MRNIKYLVVHHSGTKDGVEMSWDNIRDHHTRINGWQDIGYHFGIEMLETSVNFEVLVGRPLTLDGAHAPGRNGDSIGIMFCGDYDKHKPSTEMLNVAVRRIIVPMMKIFDIPLANVLKHSDVNSTNCPGLKFPFGDLLKKIKLKLDK